MNTSYLRFLKVMAAIGYYGSIAATAALAVSLLLGIFTPTARFSISLAIPISLANSILFDESGWAVKLGGDTNTKLTLTTLNPNAVHEYVGLYMSIALSWLLLMLLAIFIARQLKQIVDTIGTPDVFSQGNVVRIRLLGGLLIGLELVKPVVWLLIRNDVLALLNHNHITYSNEQISFGLSSWGVAGLLILGLAEVFRSGNQLKREHDLTI